MLWMRGNAVGWMIAVIVLIAATAAQACSQCHSGPNGECGPDCTCCGGAHASAPDSPLPDAPAPEPGVVDVLMVDFQFVPQDITVTPGTNMVEDSVLRSVIAGGGADIERSCREAVDRANRNGGRDNITAVLAYHD